MVEATNYWGGYDRPSYRVTQTEVMKLAGQYWPTHYGSTHLIGLDTLRYLIDSTAAPDSTGAFPKELIEWPFIRDYQFDHGYPAIVIIDRRGVIRARFTGYDEKAITAIVDILLAEPTNRSTLKRGRSALEPTQAN